jgi:electron transport complex protein RnfD
MQLLAGRESGTIGELSAILLLAASVVLIAKKYIRWEIPLSIFLAFATCEWIFGGLPHGAGLFAGDVLFSIATGSFLLVSLFMATDPVTSPARAWSRALYGVGIGLVAFTFRTFASRPEGMAFAVIIMNCLVPLVDRPHKISKKRAN